MQDNSQFQYLLQQVQDSKKKIDLIRNVTLELNKVLNIQEKLDNILKILYDQFSINYSMILLPDEHHQKLIVHSSYGYEKSNKGYEVPLGVGIIGLSALKKIPINITGIRRKRQYFMSSSQPGEGVSSDLPGLSNPESQIAIPLVSNNELIAVLAAESFSNSVFNKEDEAFLITLSQSIAVSIQNSLLFDTMEDIIAKRTEELRRSNRTKDRLFSIISHDLRGPIGSFKIISKLVSQYNKSGAKDKIDLLTQRIDESVNTLNRLLDNLLNWALTQTREIQYQPERLNLFNLLQEVKDLSNEQVLSKNLSISIESPKTIFGYGDYHMVMTVLRNALSNAIKYTPQKGSICIKISAVSKYARIEFQDTGVGIPPEKLETIFQHNETKSTRGTENEKGTGLGLLVAKEFMLQNKGDIIIQSEPGKGTKVTIVLPIKRANE